MFAVTSWPDVRGGTHRTDLAGSLGGYRGVLNYDPPSPPGIGGFSMRAGLFVGVGRPIEVEEIDPLPPGPNDVVVDIAASGVCHSDAAILSGALPWSSPAILGHEVTGTVVEVGAAVTRVKVGDRVIGSGIPACSNCFYCVRGQSHLCERTYSSQGDTPRARRADGTTVTAFASLGGFADMMTVPEASVVAVRSDLPAEQLALIGCAVTTGVGAALNTAGGAAGRSRGDRRLRRRRSVRGAGRPDRRCVAYLRDRPGGRQAGGGSPPGGNRSHRSRRR